MENCFIASFLILCHAVDYKKEACNIYLVYQRNQLIYKMIDGTKLVQEVVEFVSNHVMIPRER